MCKETQRSTLFILAFDHARFGLACIRFFDWIVVLAELRFVHVCMSPWYLVEILLDSFKSGDLGFPSFQSRCCMTLRLECASWKVSDLHLVG